MDRYMVTPGQTTCQTSMSAHVPIVTHVVFIFIFIFFYCHFDMDSLLIQRLASQGPTACNSESSSLGPL